MKKTLMIVGAIVVVAALYIGGTYNSLVKMNESINGQWAQVENQYQRRFDLIPNLVATVKGVAKQENDIFTAIAEARTRYTSAVTTDAKVAAATQVEGALGRLIAIAENYPTLKSADSYQSLMVQLEGTENRVSIERKVYNDTVREYNMGVKIFPRSLVAGMFGFGQKQYFEVSDAAKVVPKVDFGN